MGKDPPGLSSAQLPRTTWGQGLRPVLALHEGPADMALGTLHERRVWDLTLTAFLAGPRVASGSSLPFRPL